MSTEVIKVGSDVSVAAAAQRGARALTAGALVAFATETVYGVGAKATNASAVKRLRELKSRPKRPFSVHLGRPGDARQYVKSIPAEARRLMSKAWPGPVTLLLHTDGQLLGAKQQRPLLHELLCQDNVIALRCPDEPVASAMLGAVDGPVIAPSANLVGAPSPRTAAEVLEPLDGRIDLLLDCGPTRYGKNSTIVRFDPDRWAIVRKGVLDERSIRRLLRYRALFVCTGNTCRSAMAAGLAKMLLAAQYGCRVGELRSRGVEVRSAGVCASHGARATAAAIDAAKELGADISHHRSRALTQGLINESDVVFCMTDSHASQVRRMAPLAAAKVFRLDVAGNIPDPIGGGQDLYGRTAGQIERAMNIRLNEELL